MPGDARKQLVSRCSQLEFNFASAPPLPTPNEMWERAAELLDSLGAEELAKQLEIRWEARMRTAVGRADWGRRLILLNPALQKFGASEIDRTLRHELAHLLAQFRAPRRRLRPHGAEWRAACRDLGIADEGVCHQLPLPARRLAHRYLYRCENCGQEFPRVRRLRRRSACAGCCRKFAGGRYDERFHLRLVRIGRKRKFPHSSGNSSP